MSEKVELGVSNADFGSRQYVPALRWKAGEFRAIREIMKRPLKALVTPLFLVDSPAERKQHEGSKVVPNDPVGYIDFVAGEMQKCVCDSKRAFVDTVLFDREKKEDGLSLFFENMVANLTGLVPVMRLADTEGRRQKLLKRVSDVGMALRLNERNCADDKSIKNLLSLMGVQEDCVDLIVDLEQLTEQRADIKELAELCKKLNARSTPWRSFTILAGAYPKKPKFPATGFLACKRYDWTTYVAIRADLRRCRERVPAFGDYVLVNPSASPTSGSGGGGGTWPIIRYSTEKTWNIFYAGVPAVKGTVSPYFRLARECASSRPFMGDAFSYGDHFIDERAIGKAMKAGNPSSYISVDTNHHIALVATQVAGKLPAPQPRPNHELREPGPGAGSPPLDDYWA